MKSLFAVLVLPALAWAQSDPAAICRTVLAPYPQACGCVLERARGAGIADATLVKLLRNEDTPAADFDRYRPIYATCVNRASGGTARGLALPPPR